MRSLHKAATSRGAGRQLGVGSPNDHTGHLLTLTMGIEKGVLQPMSLPKGTRDISRGEAHPTISSKAGQAHLTSCSSRGLPTSGVLRPSATSYKMVGTAGVPLDMGSMAGKAAATAAVRTGSAA